MQGGGRGCFIRLFLFLSTFEKAAGGSSFVHSKQIFFLSSLIEWTFVSLKPDPPEANGRCFARRFTPFHLSTEKIATHSILPIKVSHVPPFIPTLLGRKIRTNGKTRHMPERGTYGDWSFEEFFTANFEWKEGRREHSRVDTPLASSSSLLFLPSVLSPVLVSN